MSEAAVPAPKGNPRHKWYIVHAYSNFEKKVAQHLTDQARQQGLEDCFSEILVPTEKTKTIKGGKLLRADRALHDRACNSLRVFRLPLGQPGRSQIIQPGCGNGGLR